MNSPSSNLDITVIGMGAMGGGMARALLESPVSRRLVGYDQVPSLVESFHEESKALGKAPPEMPSSLQSAVTSQTQVVLLVLQKESQCEHVCFGTSDGDDSNLLQLLPTNSLVVLCSTVRAAWVHTALERFHTRGIDLLDCPISGGPARARNGDLTLMASGTGDVIERSRPILGVLGRDGSIYTIAGGAGMGSTAKMVHQLLAGVHVVAAAESLALAAKAGLDVRQFYEIVNGAAGASWMFQDRGIRMLQPVEQQRVVNSQLQILVKDLDIVYNEAKRLGSPIPLASAALQQFLNGEATGLAQLDDSQVVQVYERVSGIKVSQSASAALSEQQLEGNQVGDFWRLPNGECEEIQEVGSEPRHITVIRNEYVRALHVSFPPQDTTLAHRHAHDSLYFFLVPGGMDVVNHVQGCDPACDCMEFGEVRYGIHVTTPLVHKITNATIDKPMLCIDAEILQRPAITAHSLAG